MTHLEVVTLFPDMFQAITCNALRRPPKHKGVYERCGGERRGMVLMDALIRRIPGVLKDAESAQQDSFEEGLLDFPHYTRPELYQGEPVPAVLFSGHHVEIARWRMKQSLGRTWERRPDLLAKVKLSADQAALLEEYKAGRNQTQEVSKLTSSKHSHSEK